MANPSSGFAGARPMGQVRASAFHAGRFVGADLARLAPTRPFGAAAGVAFHHPAHGTTARLIWGMAGAPAEVGPRGS